MTLRPLSATLMAISVATSSTLVTTQSVMAAPETSSSGYIYHLTNTNPSTFNRYNIAEGVDEQIGTADSSCDFIGSGSRIPDFAVDAGRRAVYFIYSTWIWPNPPNNSIRKLDLTTGTCSILTSQTTINSNGLNTLWRGLTIDTTRNLLFFVDNQGFPSKNNSGAENAVNETLHYLDLNAGTPVDTVLPIVKKVNTPGAGVVAETTDITFAHDITIDGDYAYISAKNKRPGTGCGPSAECDAFVESTFGAATDPSTSSTAVFRVRLFDASTHNLITGSPLQSEKIFSLLPSDSNDADIITTVIKDDHAYYSTFDWHEGGIGKFRLADFTTGSGTPVTARTSIVTNYSYDITYGFAVAPSTSGGDYFFFTDRLSAPEWRLVWAQESGTAATSATETLASSNTDQYGQIQYSEVDTPIAPSITDVARTDGTTLTITFPAPSDALAGSRYTWVATGSDASEVTGTCDSSPCIATGLDPDLTYSVTLRQVWTAGATEIIQSLQSPSVTESSPFERVSRSFDGFVTMTSTLTPTMKREMRSWLRRNSGASTVSCVGYVGNNYLEVTSGELRALARARASTTCRFFHQLERSLDIGRLKVVVSSSTSDAIRKVKVTLR